MGLVGAKGTKFTSRAGLQGANLEANRRGQNVTGSGSEPHCLTKSITKRYLYSR